MDMNDLFILIGGMSILFGGIDLASIDGKDWKGVVLRILGGSTILGIGLLLEHFCVDIWPF